MNDFTKEELQIIWKLHENGHVGTYIDGLGKFMLKVQSMIDNYCEHEWGEDPNDGYGWMCVKCGAKQ